MAGGLRYNGKIGLLSIDIDGNDYWIWDSLEIIRPAIVVIEAKVEFGMKSIVVPYSNENHHRFDKRYNGASVEALHKLGVRKGYTLVGANAHAYNLFFIDNMYLKPPFQAVETATLLQHPETIKSLYPASFFESHTFVSI